MMRADDQERDKPLSFRWMMDPSALREMLHLPGMRSRKAQRAVAAILAAAVMEARGQGRAISYSRRRDWWAEFRQYHSKDFGFDTVLYAVEMLVAEGLLTDHWIAPARRGGTGRQSTFRPALELATMRLPPIFHVPPKELIILKDREKRPKGYLDTERTCRMRQDMRATNEIIAASKITLEAPNLVREGDIIRIRSLNDVDLEHALYLYLPMIALYRVFNDNDWRRGGRMYGGWWQQCPKLLRQRLHIDGEAVVEPDFRRLHPRLLYALAGKRLDGDAYEVPGWTSAEGFAAAKQAFNVLLNTGCYREALGVIAAYLDGDWHQAADLIGAIRKRHAPVADYFHSGIGPRLQNTDAEMARGILAALRKRGIVCLPVHDSFIVQTRHQAAVLEAMEAAEDKAGIAQFFRARPMTWLKTIPQVGGASAPGVYRLAGACVTLPLQLDLLGVPAVASEVSSWPLRAGRVPRPLAVALGVVRRMRGDSHQAVADRVGLSRSHLGNVVRGRFGTSPQRAEGLVAYVGEHIAALSRPAGGLSAAPQARPGQGS